MPSLTIDPAAIARRIKPDKHRAQLATRPGSDLVAASDLVGAGRVRLLLDTSVYIHGAGNALTLAAAALLDNCITFHCSVCIGELMVGIGNADPAHPRWSAKRDHYFELIETIPDYRLLTPDEPIWAEAGLIAGTLARIQGFQPHQRKECLNDALIYLVAARIGVSVLTSNRDEFDRIQQLAGRGTFVHY